MRFFRHFMEALLNPVFLIIFVFGILLIFLHRESRTRIFWGFFALFLSLVVFSTGWIPQTITHHLENQYAIVKQPNPEIRWIVVFSGGQMQDADKPDNMILYGASIKRLVEGVRLYRELPGSKLVLSGGGVGQEIAEAKRLATLTKWFGIPDSDVVLEDKAINTAEEAIEVKKILGAQPFYLVTSAIHMHRAMLLCQSQGLTPIAAPTDFTVFWQDERWEKTFLPNAHNLVYLSIALHEILGIGWGRMTGSLS